MTVFDHGCRGGWSPSHSKGSLTNTHFGIDLELSSFERAKSCSGADGSYPRADAKSHGGSREMAVAKGSRRSLLKWNRCPSLLPFRGYPRGILHRHVDTTRRRRSK